MAKFSIDLETLYRETGNPLYVYSALADYELCPEGKPLPVWVMDYLREVATALELLADAEPPSAALARATAALRLTRRGGGGNRFAEYRLIARADSCAHLHEHRKGLQPTAHASLDWLARAYGTKTAKGVRSKTHTTIRAWIRRIKRLRAAQG
jgi:hypothetical protein